MERNYIFSIFVLLALVGIGVYIGFVGDSSETLFTVSHTVEEVAVVNGSVMYIADLGEGDDGYGLFREEESVLTADYLDQLRSINGRPAFIMIDNGTTVVVANGQRYQVDDRYRVTSLKAVAGNPAFLVGNRFIVHDGEKVGEAYDQILFFTEAAGDLAYTAVNGNRTVIVRNGTVVRDDLPPWKQLVGTGSGWDNLVYTGEGFAYVVQQSYNEGVLEEFVVKNGTRRGDNFHGIQLIGMKAGRLEYIGTYSRVEESDTTLVHGDRRLDADQVRDPIYINGSWAYIGAATTQESGNGGFYSHQWAVFLDEKQLTNAYPHIISLDKTENGLIVVTRSDSADHPTYTFRRVKLPAS